MTASRITTRGRMIGGDEHHTGISVVIDLAGHDLPTAIDYLLRQICSNGATITVSREDARRIPSYDSDADMDAASVARHLSMWASASASVPQRLLDRLTVAAATTASFDEVSRLETLLRGPDCEVLRTGGGDERRVTTIADSAIEGFRGDFRTSLGVASLKEIPKADQRLLPAQVSVFGLFHLGSEVGTHYARNRTRSLKTWWDSLLSRRFDLEGVAPWTERIPARWLPSVN